MAYQVIVLAAWNLASCNVATRKTAKPVPEAEQVSGDAMKEPMTKTVGEPAAVDRRLTR